MPASRRAGCASAPICFSALCATLAGADERRAGQGHHLAVRPGRRADRHRRGHRRRRLDPRRPRPGDRLGASARCWWCSSTRCCARASRSRASSRSATSRWRCRRMAQLPPGAVPAFLGLILLVAVLIEPWIVRRNAAAALLGAAARASRCRPSSRSAASPSRACRPRARTASDARAIARPRWRASSPAATRPPIMLAVILWLRRAATCGPTSGARSTTPST